MRVIEQRGVIRIVEWNAYPWLIHGFSTRAAGNFLDRPDDAAVTRIFGGGKATATPRQVHSSRVAQADCSWGDTRPEADAVVTNQAGILAGVRTADCVPILLVDPPHKAVAAVHAGRRGAAAGIVANALDRLSDAFGSRAEDIEAAVGPAIGACCFEVGPEVASQFAPEFVIAHEPRPHVDLIAAVRKQLEQRGVQRILDVSECTKCRTDRFFSYRDEGAGTGRMLSVVGVR